MKILSKAMKFIALLLIIVMQFIFIPPQIAHAATSPVLSALSSYSVLGGQAVTCTGATTVTGDVGVSPLTSITGFPSPCTVGPPGATHSNDASAIAAQAEALAIFSTLDQTCDQSFGAVDLTTTFPTGVGPGVYCSTSSFSLSGNLNLTGSGVHIFKTVSTLITSPGSSITGGDSCNVWWRVGSSATLGTTTAFRGNIVALNGVNAMNTGATLNGRILGLSAATVTLAANTITGPTCAGSSSGGSSSTGTVTGTVFCPPVVTTQPIIIESRRIDADSIFISWGPFQGTNTFIVQFGFVNGTFPFSTNVTGFSTTLNGIPANQPIFVRVAARNSCSIGNFGPAMLVGGPSLPNTGFAPKENNIPWYIPAGILVGISVLPFLIQRKRRFSSKS